jgi:Protein of unknown function, DUF600
MVDELEPYYQQIAESIESSIPDEWATARMEAVFFSGSSTYEGEYRRQSNGALRPFPTSREGERAFREIRRIFKLAGKAVWGRACFDLTRDGKFQMKWSYENCDENGDTIFDEEQEARRQEDRRARFATN